MLSTTRKYFLLYFILLSAVIIPVDITIGIKLHNAIYGTNCEVKEIHICKTVLAKNSYYDCNLEINCYNTNMDVQMHLPRIPDVNMMVYYPFDDDAIQIYKFILIFINLAYPIALIILTMPILWCCMMCIDEKRIREAEVNNGDEMMLVAEKKIIN